MAFQQFNLSDVSFAKTPTGITELYIPLWIYSTSAAAWKTASSGTAFLQKGTINGYAQVALHRLNSGWSPLQTFAFEASMYSSNSSSTAYLALWDVTSNSLVSASQLSTTNTTPTLLRSGQFTLTPGHSYGVTIWASGSYNCNVTKAHLIAFL
jgi:hypothetical protein